MRLSLLRNAPLGILVAAALLTSCESSVNPLIGDPRPFTIWGLLDAAADTQRVRIFSIEGESGVDRPGDLDAVVTSTDLESGETLTWRPYQVTYESGVTGHLFEAAFQPVHGRRYRLDVARSDGAVSSATVTVPEKVNFTIERTNTSPKVYVYVNGEGFNLLGVEMRYEATNVPPANVWPTDLKRHPIVFYPVEVSYQGTEEKTRDGVRYDINMVDDFAIVEETYKSKCLVTEGNPNIALRRVEFHFVAANEAWRPPGGVFDPEVLVEPGALSNVENGYGFLGAGLVVAERWIPPKSLRDFIGFSSEEGCSLVPSAGNPACTQPPVPCLDDVTDDVWSLYF